MPHKHKRKRGDDDDITNFNLPPNARASALPVDHKPRAVVVEDDEDGSQTKRSNKRRKPSKPRNDPQQKALLDDTPKQFARLMAFQQGKKLRKGLDDGVLPPAKPKQKKRGKQTKTTLEQGSIDGPQDPNEERTEEPPKSEQQLKIQPGERLCDFALRVDQSLPLSAVPKHGTRAPALPGVTQEKTYLTKHNKRLARMQAAWREDEERLRERRAEQTEEADDKREEEGLLWMDVDEARKAKKGKKASREGDIWRVLERKRRDEGGQGANGAVAGLNASTAVQAPPVLKRVKNIFKEKRGVSA